MCLLLLPDPLFSEYEVHCFPTLCFCFCVVRKGAKASKVGSSPDPENEEEINEDVKSEIEKVKHLTDEGMQGHHSIIVEVRVMPFSAKMKNFFLQEIPDRASAACQSSKKTDF